MNKEILNRLKELSLKEISLTNLCEELNLNEFEVLSMVRFLREEGINIITKRFDDDIYLFNQGELEPTHENIFSLNLSLFLILFLVLNHNNYLF